MFTMLDIIYYVAVSLDGFIAAPEGGVEWLAPFETADEDYGYSAFYASVEAVFLGSRTYQQAMIIISASRRNLDYASQAPLHPGYAGCPISCCTPCRICC